MAQQYKQTFSIRPKISASTWQLDDAIDAYYDDEMSKKTMMQIEKQIAKSIFSRFDSF